MTEKIKKWLREWAARRLVEIHVMDDRYPDRIVGAVSVRGYLYIITETRLMRYDPERDSIQTEHDISAGW